MVDRPTPTPRIRTRTVRRDWPADADVIARLERPRDDLVLEAREADGSYRQQVGPFTSYRRTLTHDPARHAVRETTTFSYSIPWFAWVFALPVRWSIARRGRAPTGPTARRRRARRGGPRRTGSIRGRCSCSGCWRRRRCRRRS